MHDFFMDFKQTEFLISKRNLTVSDVREKTLTSHDPCHSDASLKTSAETDGETELHKSHAVIPQDLQLRVLSHKPLSEFIWTTSPQPHAVRRRLILQQYPEIEKLYGSDPHQAIPAVLTVMLQLCIAYLLSIVQLPIWSYSALVCGVSATLNHSLFAAMHEGSHRTIFRSKILSEIFCILTTIPMGIPAAIPFKRYHLDHHIYQGVASIDPDIPTVAEGWFFRSRFRKFLWVSLMPATYSLRPMLTRPKEMVPMDAVNWLSSVAVDVGICYFWGLRSLLYLLLGTFFSMNFHPFAGHFISEHFILPDSDMYQETSSYYGWSNLMTYNVGYHNEHHDFPRVPGSRLPLIREIAPEYYNIPDHTSWLNVTWKFILTPSVTPFNRVKRLRVRGGELPESLLIHKYHEGLIPYGSSHHFWPKITFT